jgi:hypothetical protein
MLYYNSNKSTYAPLTGQLWKNPIDCLASTSSREKLLRNTSRVTDSALSVEENFASRKDLSMYIPSKELPFFKSRGKGKGKKKQRD